MFCPSCGAEYRRGFTSCSDCAVALLDARPEGWKKRQPASSGFPPRDLLFWFIPLSIVAAFAPDFFLAKLNPSRFHPLQIFVILISLTVSLGAFWMFVQVIDHEERAKEWIPFCLIPFMFLWYLLVRYPSRPEFILYPRSKTNRSA